MLNPGNELLPPPTSSPTASSVSSSDLDTESTGSFFHDRSTTLGTLMGVSFPTITFRNPSQHREIHHQPTVTATVISVSGGRKTKKAKKNKPATTPAAALVAERRRRRWWRLCRDDCARPASSLGEFLEIERRFGDGALFYEGAPTPPEADIDRMVNCQQQRNGRVLFADGRVLPPAEDVGDDGTPSTEDCCVLCRFSVSFPGICGGGLV